MTNFIFIFSKYKGHAAATNVFLIFAQKLKFPIVPVAKMLIELMADTVEEWGRLNHVRKGVGGSKMSVINDVDFEQFERLVMKSNMDPHLYTRFL